MPKPEQPRQIDLDCLSRVTGGGEVEPFWLPRAPIAPVGTGFGTWEQKMRERGLLG